MNISVLLSCAWLMTVVAAADATTNRPPNWARPIPTNGVPNLHQVSATLFRSAQPSAEGMKRLEAMGIRTVVNLRSFNSDRSELKETRLDYRHLTMKAWHPEHKEAVEFLRLVTDPKRTPVLVHCQHGADRTGAMCAIYRVAVEGWNKEAAIREMVEGGFGFHEIWTNLPEWIEQLDIERLRKAAGIATPPAQPSPK